MYSIIVQSTNSGEVTLIEEKFNSAQGAYKYISDTQEEFTEGDTVIIIDWEDGPDILERYFGVRGNVIRLFNVD